MLTALHTFRAVAESGSFSDAGRLLRRAPSSIARQVTRLEQELNQQLLVRSTHGLSLTPVGIRVLEQAQRALAEVEKIRGFGRAAGPVPSGPLKVSCFQSFGRRIVTPLLVDFLTRYPKVEAELDLNDQLVDLRRDQIDIAIRIGRPKSSSLKLRRLLSYDVVLCASPGYLAKHPRIETPDDLRAQNCLCMQRDKSQVSWHFSNDTEQLEVPVRGNLMARGGEPLILAARQGLGVLLITRWTVATELAEGALVELLPQWHATLAPGGPTEVFALHRGSRALGPAGRAFLTELVAACQQLG